MSKWAQVDGRVYFTDPLTIEAVQQLLPSVQLQPIDLFHKEEYYTFHDHFTGSEGGVKVQIISDQYGGRMYFEGGIRDVNWLGENMVDSDHNGELIDEVEQYRADFRAILVALIAFVKSANLTVEIGSDTIYRVDVGKKHVWREQIIYNLEEP